jgi:hypothetical protein
MWAGLENTAGGQPGIVQAGTDSGIYCYYIFWSYHCDYYYRAMYEFYPGLNPVTCYNNVLGHNFQVDVQNQQPFGGQPNQYNVIITDLTTGQHCSINSNYNIGGNGIPYYAGFIDERTKFSGTGAPARLPQFSTANMPGRNYVTYGCNPTCYQYGISTMLNAGWYNEDLMFNGGNQNINLSYDTTTGAVNQQWKNSNGT